jgi:hypothetical protein
VTFEYGKRFLVHQTLWASYVMQCRDCRCR